MKQHKVQFVLVFGEKKTEKTFWGCLVIENIA